MGFNSTLHRNPSSSGGGGTGDASAEKQDEQTGILTELNLALGQKNDVAATSDTGSFSLVSLFKRLLQYLSPFGAAGDSPVDSSNSGSLLSRLRGSQQTVESISGGLGAQGDTPATSDTGNFSLVSLFKRSLQQFATLLTRIPAIGQKAKAGSVSVVLASDSDALNVTPQVSKGAGNVDPNTQRVVLASDGPTVVNLTQINTNVGSQADAPATDDTGSFSIIALIKRGLQKWGTAITAGVMPVGGSGLLGWLSGVFNVLFLGRQLYAQYTLTTAGEAFSCGNQNNVVAGEFADAYESETAYIQVSGTGAGFAIGMFFAGSQVLGNNVFYNLQTGAWTQTITANGLYAVDMMGGKEAYTASGGRTNFVLNSIASGNITVRIKSSRTKEFSILRPSPIATILGSVGLAAGTNIIGALVANQSVNIAQLAGATVGTVTDPLGTANVQAVGLTQPLNVIEVTSAARTASGSLAISTQRAGVGLSAAIVVSAFSGTTPTLDIFLEESYDGGNNWRTVFALDRIVGTGIFTLPNMMLGGSRRRWSWTIGGTTPSFSFAINVNLFNVAQPFIRRYVDRGAQVLAGTINNQTAAYNIEGCDKVTASVNLGAATTPATYQLQISTDGTNWANVGAAVQAIANGTILLQAVDILAKLARVNCTVAGSGQTGNNIIIQAQS